MPELLLSIEGKHFERQYLLYIIECTHGEDKYYYIGQTGDPKHTTARPTFRRLTAHLEDSGRSTQNQVYRYLAVEVLGISYAAKKNSAFDKKTKQAVEDYLVKSNVKMYAYPLQPFVPSVEHSQHLNIVRKVVLFERIVINLFLKHSKNIMNKNIIQPPKQTDWSYPQALDQIKTDFKLS